MNLKRVLRATLAALALVNGVPRMPRAAEAAQSALLQGSTALPEVATRFALHDGFDRLVLTMPDGVEAVTHQAGSTLSIIMPGAGAPVAGRVYGRRLRSLRGGAGKATAQIAPGARVRVWRLDDKLVVDVFDPPANTPPVSLLQKPPLVTREARRSAPASADRPTPSAPPPPKIASEAQPSGVANGIVPVTNTPYVPPAPTAPASALRDVARRSDPVPSPNGPSEIHDAAAQGMAVMRLTPSAELPGPAIFLPLGAATGAAAFQRAGQAHVVFDVAKPLDLSTLKDDPDFSTVTEEMLADGVHLRLPLAPSATLRLTHRDDGWVLSVVASRDLSGALLIGGRVHQGVLTLDAAAPGRVVVLEDDVTGGQLFVGTQKVAGQRMASDHASPYFDLLPTWQGVVIAPVSDLLQLRRASSGFEILNSSAQGLPLEWSDQTLGHWFDGHAMTRVFDFPDLTVARLRQRLGQALRDAAITPKPSRFEPRRAVAQAMLALGMDAEAASALQAASADDPGHAGDPRARALSAIAAWLSAAAGGVPPPDTQADLARLGASDEAVFWRALLQPTTPDQVQNASALAATWPIILDYPATLRHPLLAELAERLRSGGQSAALATLLASSADPALDLSRALLLRDHGKLDDGLALLDRIASRSDRLLSAEAEEQATEWRITTGRLSPAAAAMTLDRQIYAWRGGERELRLRMRVAQLRSQAGSWRAALSLLRETESLFPEARQHVREAETKLVAGLLRPDKISGLSAFDLATLADENADLLGRDEVDTNLAPALADRLIALDLPNRAEPVLQRLFDKSADPATRAELGLRLATLMADADEATQALAVLGRSDGDTLSPMLQPRRQLLRARLLLSLGRPTEALACLADQPGAEAAELQATILEGQHDWAGAARVLDTASQGSDFHGRPEAMQRQAILREARDESRAGDMAGLTRLRVAQRARFASGEGADLFAVLTAEPIRTVSDLPRAGRELSNMQALPARLLKGSSL